MPGDPNPGEADADQPTTESGVGTGPPADSSGERSSSARSRTGTGAHRAKRLEWSRGFDHANRRGHLLFGRMAGDSWEPADRVPPAGLGICRHNSRIPSKRAARLSRIADGLRPTALSGSEDATAGWRGRRSGPARDLDRSVRRNGRGRQEGKEDPFLRRIGRQIGTPSPRDAAPLGEEADGVPVCSGSLDEPPYPTKESRVESHTQRFGPVGEQGTTPWGIANLAERLEESGRSVMWGNRSSEATRTMSIQVNQAKVGSYSGCSTRSRCIGFRDCAWPKLSGTCL